MKTKESLDWHEMFYYDAESPSGLRRKTDWRTGKDYQILRAKAGSPVGSIAGIGYYVTYVDGRLFYCHRIVMELHGEDIKDMSVDHVDGNSLNNKYENLRAVRHNVNHRNRKKPTTNKSGVVGVSLNTEMIGGKEKRRWVAGWRDMEGKSRYKYFSVTKLGEEGAFKAACEHRSDVINKLNAEGAGYTQRHGGADEGSMGH
jgi:hypothetical protein